MSNNDEVNREIAIQNQMNVSVIDTVLNVKRVFVFIAFLIGYLFSGDYIVATVVLVIVVFLVYKYMPVSISDKENRIDYILIEKADRLTSKGYRWLEKKVMEFLRW